MHQNVMELINSLSDNSDRSQVRSSIDDKIASEIMQTFHSWRKDSKKSKEGSRLVVMGRL